MAGACSSSSTRRIMFCMGAMVALLGAVVVLAVDHHAVVPQLECSNPVREEDCPEADYAYPFQSVCQEPAQFDVEYHLVAPFSNALVAKGGLVAERGFPGSPIQFTGNQSDEGNRFTLTPVSPSAAGDQNSPISLGTPFTITNTETQTKLAWRFSAWHRGVILSTVDDSDQASEFQLAAACNVPLPCPETVGARCESYFLIRATSLTGMRHVGGWIVPADSESAGNMPLLLRRVRVVGSVIRPIAA